MTRCFIRKFPSPDIHCFVKIQRDAELNVCSPVGPPLSSLLPASDPNSFFTRFGIADQPFIQQVLQSELDSLETRISTHRADNDLQRLEIAEQIEDSIVADTIPLDDTQWTLRDPASAAPLLFFYQDAFGRLLFLDHLNIEMLTDEFGSIAAAPASIEGPLVNTFCKVVDAAHRPSAELAHLPTGAEVRFALLDLSGILSQAVAAAYAYRVRMKRPPRKRKPPAKVITAADFQTFVPMPPERVVNLRDEAEFPALSPRPIETKPLMPQIRQRDEYPALGGGAAPAPRRAVSGWMKSPAPVQATQERRKTEEWPTLGGPRVAVERKKPVSGWANVKF
jgi:hypothetical protein